MDCLVANSKSVSCVCKEGVNYVSPCLIFVMSFSGCYSASGGDSCKANFNQGIALVYHHVHLSKIISTTLRLIRHILINITLLSRSTLAPRCCHCFVIASVVLRLQSFHVLGIVLNNALV